MLTAFGSLSRNMTFGKRLAQGELASDILEEMKVEGIPTSFLSICFSDLCNLELPIFRCVNAILDGKLNIKDAQSALMGRPLSTEHD